MKITEKIVNIETGEETFVERNETVQEKNEREKFLAELEAQKIESDAKELQRKAIAERLGLSADELKLLLG